MASTSASGWLAACLYGPASSCSHHASTLSGCSAACKHAKHLDMLQLCQAVPEQLLAFELSEPLAWSCALLEVRRAARLLVPLHLLQHRLPAQCTRAADMWRCAESFWQARAVSRADQARQGEYMIDKEASLFWTLVLLLDTLCLLLIIYKVVIIAIVAAFVSLLQQYV